MRHHHPIVAVALGLTAAWSATAQVSFVDATVVDAARNRPITFRTYFSDQPTGPMPVILVSHGGDGNLIGHQQLSHLGNEYAGAGYLAIHVGHRQSATPNQHEVDRPADVSFIIDQLAAGTLPLPARVVAARIDLTRIGHAGHSFGAFTAHLLGGAITTDLVARDPRIIAIVPFSPQGDGQFGFFDFGNNRNSWSAITIPSYTLAGELELDTNALGTFMGEDWRLQPFDRYPACDDKFLSIVPGADHGDMGSQGNPAITAFNAQNSRLFFDVYLRGRYDLRDQIGTLTGLPGVVNRRKTTDLNGDNRRDIFDILAYFDAFGTGAEAADIVTDEALNIFDILEFFNAFARCA